MDPTNRNTALASAMVEELARCGVRTAAVSPGSRSTPLALALWRQPTIDVTVLLDERSAGFLALGAGLATGAPAVALCTSGTAAANLHPAVCEADEAGVPLIVLTADRPPELRGIGAGQTIDQLKLYGEAARWFCELGTHEADDAGLLHHRAVACRAYAVAAGDPRPGPVHLNVAWREPLAPIPVSGQVTATDPLAVGGRGDRPLTAVTRDPGQPDAALMDELAERLAAHPRGLVVAGRQLDPALAEPVARLAAATGYPILAEPISQLRWGPHERELVISAYDAIACTRPETLRPDLVVRVGELPTSKALRQWLGSLRPLRQIVLDRDGTWREPTRTAETVVRCDPAAAADALAARLKAAAASPERSPESWAGAWRRADRLARDAIDTELGGEASPSEPGVWLALANALRDGAVVVASSSMPVRDLEAVLPSRRERVRFLSNRGANGIDGVISTAAGVASATGAPTWAVVGDLAMAHDLAGLAAARTVPNLRLLVIDNAGGGIFHLLPQAEAMGAEEFEALLATPADLDVCAAAALFGLDATAAASAAELERALHGQARVVLVQTERHANAELHRRLSASASAAIART